MKINYIILSEKDQDVFAETSDSVKEICTKEDKIYSLHYEGLEKLKL